MSSYKRIPKSLVKKSTEKITVTEEYTGNPAGYYQYVEDHELQKVKEKVQVTQQQMFEEIEEQRSTLVEKAYQEGFERAKKEVEGEIYAQHEAFLTEAKNLYAQANAYHQSLIEEAQKIKAHYVTEQKEQIVELIVTCAEKLLHQEIETHPEKMHVMFQEILAGITYENKKIFLRVHPKTREWLKHNGYFPEDAHLEILPDGTLSPGDLVVETEREYIDATIHTQIDTLKQVLRSVLDDAI